MLKHSLLLDLLQKKAYEIGGAKHVEFLLNDDEISLIRYQYGKDYVFENFPK